MITMLISIQELVKNVAQLVKNVVEKEFIPVLIAMIHTSYILMEVVLDNAQTVIGKMLPPELVTHVLLHA